MKPHPARLTALVLAMASLWPASMPAQEPDYAVDPAWLEGLVFRSIGPSRGGRVTAVAGTPSKPNLYYMGSTGGGVWKTVSAGAQWVNVSDEFFETGSVGAIEVSLSDPNVVVAGMGESPFRGVASSHGDGVYISADAGATWTHAGLENTRQISTVRIHPDNPDVIWVAAMGSPWAATEDRGVYKTTDGGETWRKVLYVDENTGAVDLSLDHSNPRILYAAMWDFQRTPWEIRSGGPGSGVHKSTNGGESWEAVNTGLPEVMGKIGVAASPARPGLVWALVEAKDDGGLYRSEDGGKSWNHVNGERVIQARSWYYMHVYADPQNEHTVYVQNAPFLRSIDDGKTFTPILTAHGDYHDMWINPDHPEWLIVGNDGGAEISFDAGTTWSTLQNQPTGQFYRVNADNDFAYQVYGGQQDNTTIAIRSRSPDGSIGREDYHPVGGCESAHISFDPDDPRLVYAGCFLGLISEYDVRTGGQRDIRVYPALLFGVPASERKYRFNWNAPIVVSQHDPEVIYHAGNVLLKSTDRGHSWTEVSPDLTRNDKSKQGLTGRPITNEITENYNTIMYVAESPHEAGTMWAGTDDGLVHITRDAGATWADITPRGIGEALINAIDVSPHDPSTAYVAVTRYKFNDHTPLIYKATEYGRRWRQIGSGIPDGAFVRVVREDPVTRGLLFAGTETGLYVSFDDGGAWQPLQRNLPVAPITDIKIHGRDLVMSTQGRAFWILDDISPLRQMSGEVLATAAHLFTPEPAYIVNEGAFAGLNQASGQNPPGGAVLYYSLSSDMDLEETPVQLEIRDGSGRLVRTLTSDAETGEEGGGEGTAYALPAKRGLNRAIWDLAHDPVTKIEGVFAFGAGEDGQIPGYTVGPGRYTLTLIVGETTREQPLELRMDPRLEVSLADIQEKQRLLEATYAMLEELHQSVVSLRQVRSQVEQRLELHENDDSTELRAAGDKVTEAIEAWEKSVITREWEGFQDVLNWPSRLNANLEELMGLGFGGNLPPVTVGQKQRFDDLQQEWRVAMSARDEIVDGPIASFNALFRERDEPALVVPGFDGVAP